MSWSFLTHIVWFTNKWLLWIGSFSWFRNVQHDIKQCKLNSFKKTLYIWINLKPFEFNFLCKQNRHCKWNIMESVSKTCEISASIPILWKSLIGTRVNDDRIFIFWVNYPLKCLRNALTGNGTRHFPPLYHLRNLPALRQRVGSASEHSNRPWKQFWVLIRRSYVK